MSSYNVPDDWDLYYTNCFNCGKVYHESENYCPCDFENEDELVNEKYDCELEMLEKK